MTWAPFTAADALAPLDTYGVSKMEAEQGLREIALQTGMEGVAAQAGGSCNASRAVSMGWRRINRCNIKSKLAIAHVLENPMNGLMLELPMDALVSPGASAQSLAAEARFMLALKLFEVGRLSSGKAGLLCGMGRVEFLLAAGRAGVAVVDMDAEELNAEFASNV